MSIVNVNGTVALFFANFLSKVFGAIYRIPLSNFLGTEGMGLYQMAFPIYSFLLTIITGGISITLTRKVASSRAKGDKEQIQKDFIIAKRMSFLLGIILFLCLCAFSYPLALLQGNASAIYGYAGISLGFVFACMLGAYRGYYQGFGNMLPTAISQVLEQMIKLILGLTFASILVKFGIIYGVLGAVLGVSVSELICFLYFVILNRKLPKFKVTINRGEYRLFFKQVVPVSISYGILPMSSLIDSFLIINLLTLSGFLTATATSLYGLETGMILPLINMPNVLISAIAITAIPELTYKQSKGEDLSKSVSKMFKLAYIFILPCAVGLFLLSKQILGLIYPALTGEVLEVAVVLLKLSIFEMFFLCFVTISNSILQAVGKTKVPIYSLLVGMATKILLTLVFVTNAKLNIYGLVLASSVGYFTSAIINLVQIKKQAKFSLRLLEIIAPIIACLVMSLFILAYLKFITNYTMIGIITIVLISIVTYFGILWALKLISIKELKNMLQNSTK